MTYVDLCPNGIRPVQVLINGTWHDGDLEAYRGDHNGWAGYVRWSAGSGQPNYLGWFREHQLRGVEG